MSDMENQLSQWFDVKRRLRESTREEAVVNEWDIWWVSFGENVGFEINGKSADFSRPAIVYKKLSRQMFLVVPTTTQSKNGSWYVSLHHDRTNMWACLQQIRVIDYRRLHTKLGSVGRTEVDRIRLAFNKLYG